MQTYFSYANTAERGITGSNRLMRHNFNLRATTGLFRDRIKLDGNISFMRQVVKDKPVPGGFYMNPLVGLYRFPRGVDMTPYREHFEVYDPDRKLGVQTMSNRIPIGSPTASAARACATGSWPLSPPTGR